ncbi:MAG: class I SAM-dependent methyltransferase [Deltaproteobacteria bacterium]|nr:class I SAM-dependent methyltransferase [Deltaproteobacteria bacterium]
MRAVSSAMRELVPPGSRVLEIGYGDGLLTCYLAQEFGWHVVGLEVNPEARRVAQQYASRYGLLDRLEFRCDDPQEIYRHRGQFDAVFIKTVLYNSPSLGEYERWLDWILSVLRPGGIFINFETGRGNALTQWYRRLRRRSYTDRCLYSRQVEALYDVRFEIIDRRYYGGWSQFLAFVAPLYFIASRLEETMRPRNPDNSFIVSIIARRPGCS